MNSWDLPLVPAIRPLFFYFLVYGFLGRKNGSVGRKKKKKKNPNNLLCQVVEKKLHGNSSKKWCFKEATSFLQVYTVIKVVTQNFSNRYWYLSKQRKYLEEFSSRFGVIKLKLK